MKASLNSDINCMWKLAGMLLIVCLESMKSGSTNISRECAEVGADADTTWNNGTIDLMYAWAAN
jgi:hypothetical protein